ncbi:MAG: radical SAM protein [Acidaminococcus intestini]|uniref:Radical SAM protein n=1 Tax=Acidaminococcus intestini TaxID=187327 RepID=A0A943I5C4_9FIRM|nr:radical SAM protein [Acidaminococcus intestini]
MSILDIKLPVMSKGITLGEIPNKVALFFELGNCNAGCEGCHSKHLWLDCKEPMSLKEILELTKEYKNEGAEAVLLMGGTTNGIPIDDLVATIYHLSNILPVGLYSGSDDMHLHLELVNRTFLKWLKIGSYQKDKGGLDSKDTNQRFFEFDEGGSVIDRTKDFQR